MRIVIIALISLLTLPVHADEIKKGPTTKFEQVLLQRGTLTLKEFFKFGKFNRVNGEIAVLTDINTGKKVYALRVSSSYYNSDYDNGEASGVFDAKEVSSAISSLEFMNKKLASLADNAPYTEVVYQGHGDPQFGFYVNGKDRKGFFKVNYKASIFFDANDLSALEYFFQQAKQKIISLGGTLD
ncbi:hypothetical protein [Kordiimonas marina]|uniref:hypothetical protein n=1 Tax=Kordiimonas marina TaxID=2872312 RepID=UPI001FF14FCE|nr:hypothetical protein [Kordiimonas marina]MCJ9429161.1 hypothetical protein [Kordiimonas marina]